MKTNFHTHCKRCRHAFGTESDYVKFAVNQGLEQLGFSDHAPFPNFDFGNRMPFRELPEYLSAVDQLKAQYDNIQIFKGLEIEYLPMYNYYYPELFEKYKVEYLILGEHWYMLPIGEIRNIYEAESTEDYIDYAKAICKGIETGWFSFVAHPDLMFINHFAWDDNCEEACERIIECADRNNAILEFNANGYRRLQEKFPDGKRYPYPHMKFWDMVKTTNIRVIIGSDCHAPHQIFDPKVELAYKTVKELGLNLIETIF